MHNNQFLNSVCTKVFNHSTVCYSKIYFIFSVPYMYVSDISPTFYFSNHFLGPICFSLFPSIIFVSYLFPIVPYKSDAGSQT